MLVHTLGVVAGVESSVFAFSGELSDMELSDKGDCVDPFPKLETFIDSFCSSDSLSGSCVVSSWGSDLV